MAFNLTGSASRRARMNSSAWAAAAALALGSSAISAAHAKPQQLERIAQAAEKSAQRAPGKLTPEIRAELIAHAREPKKILSKHRLEWCDTTQSFAKSDPAAAQRTADAAAIGVCAIQGPPDTVAVRNAAIPNARSPWITIRVATHLFANDDGSNPTATPADAQGNLAQLNADYAPGRIRFVSTGIFTHRSSRFREPKDVDGEIDAMKARYAQAPTRQINVFVFEAATANPQLLGRGTFSWSREALSVQGGFFCDNDAFGLGERTATHEFGHCLGLWHPFHGTEEVSADGCGGCREVAGRTPAQGDNTGDFCSDTPPTSRNYNCGPPTDNPQTPANEAIDSCNGKPFGVTDFHNYMGYADDSCINRFTPQQYGRMRAWINHKLKGWIVGTGPNDAPVVESTTPSGRVLSLVPGIGATFSQPMNKATVQAAFRILPAVRGTFVWAADAKSFTFRPAVRLLSGTNYSVQVLGTARNMANRPLDGNYNGRIDAPAVDAVSWGFRTAGGPANDLFARAQVLAGARGTVSGSNEEATKERGEPRIAYDNGGASIWYRWVAPSAGIATFDTEGSGFDTLLGAYEGTAVAALAALAGDDDSGSGLSSKIAFHVDAGDVVWVSVDGVRNDNGTVEQGRVALNWQLTPAPSNDLFARGVAIGGASGSVRGNNEGAWSENGEPSHDYNTPNSSIWYRWRAPASGLATFNTEGSNFDTILAVYTGTSVSTLSKVASDDDSGSGTLSSVSFTAVAGVTYAIAVNGSGSGVAAPRGAVKLNWKMLVAPANDLFAQAQVLGTLSGTVIGTNAGANVEVGEPSHNYSRNASVWYRFTAPSNGFLEFSTRNSNFDTVLAAYEGASVSSLSQLAQNDDVSGALWSRVAFEAVAGHVYSIAVDSSSSSQRGNVALNWTFYPAPANDNFAQRQVLDGASGRVTGNNIGATTEPNETSPVSTYSRAIASVWYQWTAPASGVATFSTAGSDFDTELGAYVQTAEGADLIESDDDSGGQNTSALSFDATAGVTYIIVVESANNYSSTTRGNIVLGWSLGAPSARLKEVPPSIRRSDAEPEGQRLVALKR